MTQVRQSVVDELNSFAEDTSNRRRREVDPGSARPIRGINHIGLTGQSLGAGWGANPPFTPDPPFTSNLSLGQSVHGGRGAGEIWAPYRSKTFEPLRGVIVGRGGETVQEQALAYLKHVMSIRAGVPEEAATKLVATNGAFGGRTLEMLSKGATPNEYGRMPTACEAVKREAERIGEPYRYLATLWLGGEHNYLDENGGSSDKAQYKAGLRRLVADLRSDCQCGIAQQAEPFAVFSYQAGCQFTRDGTNLSVGMAQWELSEEEPHWYLASPAYPVPDIGGHLSALGTAWLGQIFGKVMARVLLDGVRWRPLAPLMAVRHGRDVFVPYDVPVAPLAFRPTFLGRRSVMFPLKGFALIDDAGEVPLRFAEIVAPRVVRVELGRETSAEARPRLRYAGRRNYNGHGNLTDSDATLATANFRQDPAVTEEDEFASSLEGKPFPLWNWSIAYEIPIEEPSKSVLG